MKHDDCVETKQDIIDAKTFGNIHLGVHVLDPELSDTKQLRIRLGRAFITEHISADIKLDCPCIFIKTLKYFYEYNIYCEPYLKEFESFCRKLNNKLKNK